MKIPVAVERRLKVEVPKFQKILSNAQTRDINEADTVAIVADMLQFVFGFDKYEEITREFAIKNTYVDLVVKTGKSIDYLIEVKSIGTDLKEPHLKQAIDYAANQGVQWAVLTNGIEWQAHRVTVDGKVASEQVFRFNFCELSTRSSGDIESLFLLCKKGLSKGLIDAYYEQSQSFNKYVVGVLLQSEMVSKTVRTWLRKLNPSLKVDLNQIEEMIASEVLKREVVASDGDDAKAMIRKTKLQLKRLQKPKKTGESE